MRKLFFIFIIAIIAIASVGCNQATKDTGENVDKNLQTVHIQASEWQFTPQNLEVHTGKVKFVVENKGNRMHGFGIKELGLDFKVGPGETIEKTVEISKVGTYEFECTVLCGSLDQHSAMNGQLIVK